MRFFINNILVAISLTLTNFPIFLKNYYAHSLDILLIKISFTFAIFLLLSVIMYWFKYLWLGLMTLVLMINSIASYYIFNYGIVISSTLLQSILTTNKSEAFELININLIIWLLVFCVLPLITIYYLRYKEKLFVFNLKSNFMILSFASVLLVASIKSVPKNIYALNYLSTSLSTFMPLNYILALKNHLAVYYLTSAEKIENISQKFDFSYKKHIPHNLKAILVIGESSRRDHWGINGYSRNTTPHLNAIDHLVSFDNAHSLATNTLQSVRNIMRLENHMNLSSFISVFNHLNFKSLWLSNQGTRYSFDSKNQSNIINSIVKEADNYIFSDDIRTSAQDSNYDEYLLPYVNDALKKNENDLIVIHTMGSHRLYDLRYPTNFQKFKPVCYENQIYYKSTECTDTTKLINSYDNSILYTDYFLSELIKLAQDHNAFILYVSDHGESLGENGIFAHAYPMDIAPPEQTQVASLLWFSTKFLQDNNQYLINAQNRQHLHLDHSYIFHTILDCAGIKSDVIDKNKSLCSYNKN